MSFRILAMLLLAACRTPAPQAPTAAEGHATAFLEAKRRTGVDVFAVGHEPEWYLDIDEQGELRLLPLEGDSLRTSWASFRKTRSGRMTRYELRQDGIHLRLTLSKQPCTDNMSGRSFPLTAVVEWYGPESPVRTLTGCAIRIR
ncbi:MAG: hypothetical protein EBZ67_02905 [Chitinophagia bacterium]|nr:hypothetical protein [Chitinophagia bacterium]